MEDNIRRGFSKSTELSHTPDFNHKDMQPTIKPELCKGDEFQKDNSNLTENTPRNPITELDEMLPQISYDEDPSIAENSIERKAIEFKKFSNNSTNPTEKKSPPAETQPSEYLTTEYGPLFTEKSERPLNGDVVSMPIIRTISLDSTTVTRYRKTGRVKKRLIGSLTSIDFKTIFGKQPEKQTLLSDAEYSLLNDKTCAINSLPKFSKIRKHRAHIQHYYARLRDALQKHGLMKKKNAHKELFQRILTTVHSNRKPLYYSIKACKTKIIAILHRSKILASTIKKSLSKTINPIGTFRMTWELICFIFIIFDLVFMPFDAGFELDRGPFLQFLLFFETIFFMVDILMNFHTGYIKEGILIKQHGLIAVRYLQSWFWMDLIATFPFDWIWHNSVFDHNSDYESEQVSRYIRIIKLIRIFRFKAILKRLEDRFQFDSYVNGIVTLVKLVFLILICCHWAACFWYLVGMYNYRELNISWLQAFDAVDLPLHHKYVLSLYWAVATMLTVGYGDVAPRTNTERFYVVLVMLCGCGVFGFTMNSIGMLLQSIHQHASKARRNIWAMKKFMHAHNLNKTTQDQVQNYLEYMMEVEIQQKMIDQNLLASLSDTLRSQVLREINGKALSSNQLFHTNFGTKFLFELYHHVDQSIYSPDQVIFKENDTDIAMYFIKTGRVQIYLENNKQILKTLIKEESFGEYTFFTNRPRMASAKSENFSCLLYIKQKKFLEILENFPYEKEMYHHIKDDANIYKNYSKLKIFCYACEKPDHYAMNCPSIHYTRNKDEAIEYFLKQTNDFRTNFKRRKYRRFHALSLKILKKVSERILAHYSEAFFNQSSQEISQEHAVENSIDDKLPIAVFLKAQSTVIPATKGDLDQDIPKPSDEFIGRKNKRKKVRIIKEVVFDHVRNFVAYYPNNNISSQIETLNKKQRQLEKKLELQREIQAISERLKIPTRRNKAHFMEHLFLESVAREAVEGRSQRLYTDENEVLFKKEIDIED